MDHTPGPWRWKINHKSKVVQLCGGKPRFDMIVMDFVRWGFSGATPRFNIERRPGLHLMHKAGELSVPDFNRLHHASWFQVLNHPDAVLIQSAPDLLQSIGFFLDALNVPGGEGTELMMAAIHAEKLIRRLKGGHE